MRKQSAKSCLACVTHRSIQVASEQCPWFSREQCGMLSRNRHLLLWSWWESVPANPRRRGSSGSLPNVSCWLYVTLLRFFTHLSFPLHSSKALSSFLHYAHPILSLLDRGFGVCKNSENISPPRLFFHVLIPISALVGTGWQGVSQEESKEESCG